MPTPRAAASLPPTTSLGEVLATYGAGTHGMIDSDCFLSVVTRTQGRRPHLLAEVLSGLAEQTDRDFEVVVVRHRTNTQLANRIDELVAAQPGWMRIRVLDVASPGRSAPLNAGFEAARGTYVAIHDDDDLALPSWVATFRELDARHPGRVLRAVAARQHVVARIVDAEVRAEQQGELDRPWPPTFSFLDHLIVNSTPPISLAFPRAVFADLGERFDESLDTTEDWDFLMRAAGLVGVACSPTETSVYRWWVEGESSRTEHTEDEWDDNHRAVQDRLDQRVLLLPAGSVTALRTMITTRDERIAELIVERDREAGNAQQLLDEAQDYLARLKEAEERIRRQRAKIQRLRGES
ncbi:MAG: glycosyltransferase family 2 protein [Nocardioides sp.]|uniref:glycosyltransferase family 2 protein n=1 Tax=Nocardioides sp. TaxID=35761 RepID=UPI003265FEE9